MFGPSDPVRQNDQRGDEVEDDDRGCISRGEAEEDIPVEFAWHRLGGKTGEFEDRGRSEHAEPGNAFCDEGVDREENSLAALAGADLVVLDHIGDHRG